MVGQRQHVRNRDSVPVVFPCGVVGAGASSPFLFLSRFLHPLSQNLLAIQGN